MVLNNLSIALSLMPQTTGFDVGSLYVGGSSGTSTPVYSAGQVGIALKQAEDNEAKQIAQVEKQSDVVRDLARYEKVVASAKSIDDVLDDPIARRVFLTANGLRSDVDNVGLAKRALNSDISDPDSLAIKIASINGGWYETVKTYNFNLVGVGVIKTSDAIAEIKNNYVKEKRLDLLDSQMPGLGTAMLFKEIAASLDTPIKVLGSKLGREVIQGALNIPDEIAVQSLVAQEKAITTRLDVKNLSDPKFVDRLVQRYLINKNGASSGLVA